MKELADGFSGEISVKAGYDFRGDDRRGAESTKIVFVLSAPDGGFLTWTIHTGWMLRPVRDIGWTIFSGRAPFRGTQPGTDYTGEGPSRDVMSGELSLHHPKQLKAWWPVSNGCQLVPGECFGDTAFASGDTLLDLLVEFGDGAVWKKMIELYPQFIKGE